MTVRSETDIRLAAWLADEASARAPERLIHSTRDRIATTRQIGRLRTLRLRLSSFTSRAGVMAVAVVSLAVVVTASASFLGSWSAPGFGPGSRPPTPRPTLTSLEPYACPLASGTCLGPLPAGAYVTHSFVPQVGYVVPDGWVNTTDTRGELDLSFLAGGSYTYPDGIQFHDGVSIFRRPLAESSTSQVALQGIGATARDLAQWLAGHVDLVASTPTPVTIGNAAGYRIAIAVPKGPRTAPDHCTTDHGEPACVSLFLSADPAVTYGFGLVGPESAIVYLLDTPSGDTVMVVIDDVDGVDPNGLTTAATPIVNSLLFGP